jgi:hypothetical protein
MVPQPFVGPWPLLQFLNIFTQAVGLLGRVISPSQGRYAHAGQHKHRINARTDIHVLRGIRIYDPSVRAGEDYSCLRPRPLWSAAIAILSQFSPIKTSVYLLQTQLLHNRREERVSHFSTFNFMKLECSYNKNGLHNLELIVSRPTPHRGNRLTACDYDVCMRVS